MNSDSKRYRLEKSSESTAQLERKPGIKSRVQNRLKRHWAAEERKTPPSHGRAIPRVNQRRVRRRRRSPRTNSVTSSGLSGCSRRQVPQEGLKPPAHCLEGSRNDGPIWGYYIYEKVQK